MSRPPDIAFASPGDLAQHRLRRRVSFDAPPSSQAPGGHEASTFKSRMRVRETNELARRYVAPAPSLRMHFDDSMAMPFPPGTPVAYEPPRTPANGIPQTFSSRRFRSAGRRAVPPSAARGRGRHGRARREQSLEAGSSKVSKE